NHASFFLSLLGWTFVPDFLTSRLLTQLHRFSLLHPTKKARPTTYLMYTLINSARSLEPNFYEILGVSPDVDDNGLKVAFRQFAKRYHPDRPSVGAGGEELFMRVRDSFEALKIPLRDVLNWKHCSSTKEYLNHGIIQSSGYHIVSIVALLFWSAIGRPSPVSFWRYILFAALLLTELSLLLSPTPSPSTTFTLLPNPNERIQPSIFTLFFPRRVIYQNVLFLHQLFMFMSVALSRVAPQLFPVEEDPRMEAVILERVKALVGVANRETSIMLNTELRSILPNSLAVPSSRDPAHPSLARPASLTTSEAEEALGMLVQEMEELIIETNLKQDIGPLRSAWEMAVRRMGKAPKPINFWEQGDDDEEDEEEDGEKTARPKLSSSPSKETVIPAIGELPSPRPSPPPVAGGSPKKGHTRTRSGSF
ncbi:hypothetical protein BDQ17DRAFT_1344433, partial [Cyathus striatus]